MAGAGFVGLACLQPAVTAENARMFRNMFAVLGPASAFLGHMYVKKRFAWETKPSFRVFAHLGWSLMSDLYFMFIIFCMHQLSKVIAVDRTQNRLTDGRLHGPRVCVVGNGPSALDGEPQGDCINGFDEVVRFNNFQTKSGDFKNWVGSKCTVHFSDGVLFPTYKRYAAPGATIILSLIADNLAIAFSYFCMRAVLDARPVLAMNFLSDPNITWIDKERIESLKKKLGLTGVKHPTSGMLAIDYFVEKAGVQLPVVITGFDFFQGPTIHYYDKYEPLWERFTNYVGVNQHSPLKEKIYVEKLVAEGKVIFLKNLPKKPSADESSKVS